MRFLQPKFLILPALLILFAVPLIVFGQSLDLPSEFAGLPNADIKETISNIVKIVLGFLGVLTILFLLYGGFVWLTSGGNADKISQAKKIIASAVIGLLLILTSYAIASFIVGNLGNAINGAGTGTGTGTPPIPTPTGCAAVPAGEIHVLSVTPIPVGIDSTATIKGCNFGSFGPTSKVYFVDAAGVKTEATSVVCGAGSPSWNDKTIKVKVPPTLVAPLPTSFAVEVENSGVSCADSASCGNAVVTEDDTPSIDCLNPERGPINSKVEITGSHFGAVSDIVLMTGETGPVQATIINSWTPNLISYIVPNNAISGDVKVQVGAITSNGSSFDVTCNEATAATDCPASNCCASNICQESSVCSATPPGTPGGPVITGLSPTQGDDGTFVTVSGKDFGSLPGELRFFHRPSDTEYVNSFPLSCSVTDIWKDDQIIFKVPEPAIPLINGNSDVTVMRDSDSALSAAVNFTVNDDPLRPGLCSLDPTSGIPTDTVTLKGERFTGGSIKFGGFPGVNDSIISDILATSEVPSLAPGKVGAVVNVAGLDSNYLNFTVLDTASGPRIDYLEPTTGKTNQYIQIYGSGFGSAGLVYFSDGVNPPVLANTVFPAACGGDFWDDDHITVKVPSGLTNGTYSVYVKLAAVTTNSKDFVFDDTKKLTPGICLIDPKQANVGFANLKLVGEGFGTGAGTSKIAFSPAVTASAPGSWTNTEIKNITVPAGAQTGLVRVTNNDGETGGIPFKIGTAPTTVPVGPQCTYAWTFKTGNLPFGLKINESCSVNSQSPSPFPYDQLHNIDPGTYPLAYDPAKAETNAPTNASIIGRFTNDLLAASIPGSITVRKCNSGPSFTAASCAAVVVGGSLSAFGDDGFRFDPTSALAPETWYQVTIANTLQAEDLSFFQGIGTLGNSWYFRTRTATMPQCVVTSAAINPDSATILLGNNKNLTSYGYDSSSCVACNSPLLSWTWSQTDPTVATLEDTGPNKRRVWADKDRVGSTRVDAEVDSLVGSSAIEIKAEAPHVKSFTPSGSCQAACTNTWPTANFNVEVQNVNTGTVKFYKCADSSCAVTTLVPSYTVSYLHPTVTIETPVTDKLDANTWYQVRIFDGVTNTYVPAESLTNLNWPPASPDSFEWRFKTGDTICEPSAVSISPSSPTAYINRSVNFQARAFASAVPGCGTINLNSAAYNWTWSSSDVTVATIPVAPTPSNKNVALTLAPAPLPAVTNIKADIVLYGLASQTPLTVVEKALIPGTLPKPFNLVGQSPPDGGTYCRNAQVFAKFSNSVKSVANFWDITCASGPCPVGQTKILKDTVTYDLGTDLWPANDTITVTLPSGATPATAIDKDGQVWTATGAATETWTFKTTDGLCSIDFVTVDPHPFTFNKANDTYGDTEPGFVAQAHDKSGIAIGNVDYKWRTVSGPLITVPGTAGPVEQISSRDINGVDYAFVDVTTQIGSPVNLGSGKGYSRIKVDICEVPWAATPYIDSDYDFSLNYCPAKLASDPPLPALPFTPLVRTGSGDVLREHIFVVDTSQSGILGDVNTPPKFDPLNDVKVKIGELVYFQVKATDEENDQFIMYADQNELPTGASFNPYSGVFIWVPQSGEDVTATFRLRDDVTDPLATLVVNIEVEDAAGPVTLPTVDIISPCTTGATCPVGVPAQVGTTATFRARVNTPGAVDAFVWDFQDSGKTGAPSGGDFAVEHTWAEAGTHQVTFRAKVAGVWSAPAIIDYIVVPARSDISPLKKLVAGLKKIFGTRDAQAQIVVGQEYDIIVVRVMRNLEHLDPMTWYKKYAPNPTGDPQEIEIDGYPAIKDGTTIYVAAANIASGNIVYTNIYLISYNDSATEGTKAVFNQLVDSWRFNQSFIEGDSWVTTDPAYCINEPDIECDYDSDCAARDFCNSKRAMIRRDAKRFTDIHAVARAAEEYATSHKFCQNAPNTPCVANAQCPSGGACISTYPKLTAGTYLSGLTTSKWPSWIETMPNVLALSSLPIDPINKFEDCTAAGTNNYDPETCWDAVAESFSCPANSKVYLYTVKQGGTQYEMSADLETKSPVTVLNWKTENPNVKTTNNNICNLGTINAVCGNSILEPAGADGTLGTADDEKCDGGFTNSCPVGSNNPYFVGCKADCTDWLPLPATWSCGGKCGNGILDAPFEQCERPNSSVLTSPTGWDCTLGGSIGCSGGCQMTCTDGYPYNGVCGNGKVELPEVCDDGLNNGKYGYCNTGCSGYNEYCGDGVINGGEECDTFQGLADHSCPAGLSLYCNSECRRACSDLSVAAADQVCGDGIKEGTEQCEPDLYLTPEPVDSSLAKQYVCGDTSSGVNACRIVGGWCGDGTTQVPFESCDYSGASCLGRPDIKCTSNDDCPSFFGFPPLPGICLIPPTSNGQLCDNFISSCEYCSNNCELTFLPENYCGDSIVDLGPDGEAGTADDVEVCDEGEFFNGLPGHCNATCTVGTGTPCVSSCGNSIKECSEICDNGVAPFCSGPGTPATCNGDPGACNTTCNGVTPTSSCGNGTPDAGEICDDGWALNGSPLHCNSLCSGNTPAVCGNTVPEPAPYGSEECDDGNLVSGDGCDNLCKLEAAPPTATSFCGDGAWNNTTRCTHQTVQAGHTCTIDTDCNDLDVPAVRGFCATFKTRCLLDSDCSVGDVCVGASPAFNSSCTVPPEFCDNNGNNGQPAMCWTDCSRLTKYCGDDNKDTPNDKGLNEFCDDGANNGLIVGGCNASCTGNVGQICGDARIDGTEQCDKCSVSSTNYCKADGTIVTCDTVTCQIKAAAATCGNSIKEAGEACDFGPGVWTNKLGVGNCYKCTWLCGDTIVYPDAGACPVDLVTTNGECCDAGWAVNGTAVGSCNAYCNDIVHYICGDSVVTSPGEACDNLTPDQTQTCVVSKITTALPAMTYTYSGTQTNKCVSPANGAAMCAGADNVITSDCCQWGGLSACDSSEKCGDNVANGIAPSAEQCDGTDIPSTCKLQGFAGGGTLKCKSNCAYDTSGCFTSPCGNGVLDPGEQCDSGNLFGGTCQTEGYDSGTLGCNNLTCQYIETGCGVCSNGVKDGSEECDGTDFGGTECSDIGFDGGPIACTSSCTYDTSGCINAVCHNNILEPTELCDGGPLNLWERWDPQTSVADVECTETLFFPGKTGWGDGTLLQSCEAECTSIRQDAYGASMLKSYGLDIKTKGGNVSYLNGKLGLPRYGSSCLIDPQAIKYPDALVNYHPGVLNRCSLDDIPWAGVSSWENNYSGFWRMRFNCLNNNNSSVSWQKENTGFNVVAVKVVAPSPAETRYAAFSWNSFKRVEAGFSRFNHIYPLYPSAQHPDNNTLSWKCTTENSGKAAPQGVTQWYQNGFDDSAWGYPVPITDARFTGTLCAKDASSVLNSPHAEVSSWAWAPEGCSDVMYCRLKYWVD